MEIVLIFVTLITPLSIKTATTAPIHKTPVTIPIRLFRKGFETIFKVTRLFSINQKISVRHKLYKNGINSDQNLQTALFKLLGVGINPISKTQLTKNRTVFITVVLSFFITFVLSFGVLILT